MIGTVSRVEFNPAQNIGDTATTTMAHLHRLAGLLLFLLVLEVGFLLLLAVLSSVLGVLVLLVWVVFLAMDPGQLVLLLLLLTILHDGTNICDICCV